MPRGRSDRDDLSIADGFSSTLELERRIASAAPAPLREKLQAAPISGERKPVTALFADVVGSTALAESMDPEEWIGVVTQAFEVLAEAAYRYEGTVAQLLGDGLLAFFGAPLAHEDDPERAIRAGVEMVREIEALGDELGLELRIRVGINTGLVVVGNVGNDLRYEYTAVGDAMNVASRMQAAASPGSVLVTEETHRLAAGQFEVVDLGGIEVRGRSERVRAYEVVAAAPVARRSRGVPGLESPTIGRAEELTRLRQALEVVRAGRGRAAVVLGDPGIGKTRLLADLRAGSDGEVGWVEGQCLSYGARLPYGLVLSLVRSLLGAPPPLADEHVAEALERHARELLGEPAPGAVRYLRHLLGLPLPATEADALARLDPERLHVAYVDALRRLLDAAARARPLVLVCEDVHWADAASVETLRPLLSLAAEAPILLLLTCRPERDVTGWRLVTEARETYGDALTELALSPLSPDDSRVLVAHLLRIEALPEELRRLILSKGEGNPFFIEEVIRMLVERGAIERRGDDWVAVERVEEVEIPTTLHGLLLARIDRLPEAAKAVLRVAAVIGRRFSVGLLEEVADGDGVAAEVSALEAAGLVRLASATPALEYEFRHALVQEAAYGSLLKRERRRLHRAVGEALERLQGVDAATLALHFEQAGDETRATRYLTEAGRHALKRFAHLEARELFDRALSYLARADDSDEDFLRRRVETALARAEAGYTFAPFDEEVALLERTLADAERLGDRRLEGYVLLWLARNLGLGARGDATGDLVERVRSIAEEVDDDYLRGQPLALAGAKAFWAGRFREAASALPASVPLLERFGDVANASYYAGQAAVAYARLGEFREADRWIAELRRLAQASGDPNSGLDADIFAGAVEAERGNLAEGITLARRGADRAAELGNAMCEAAGTLFAGEHELRRGAAADAIPTLERSGRAARECNALGFAELSSAWLNAARSQLPDVSDGLAGLDDALHRAREVGDPLAEAELLRYRANVRLRQDPPDWDAAVRDFEAALEIVERLEARPYVARTLREYGLALQRAGRDAEAGVKLAQAMALSAEMGLAA
ncbi:MAG: AAA family ATPase [Thermoleophilia bacterium]|nr:AAA family ATPase [Thermoleophilia bacterium]